MLGSGRGQFFSVQRDDEIARPESSPFGGGAGINARDVKAFQLRFAQLLRNLAADDMHFDR